MDFSVCFAWESVCGNLLALVWVWVDNTVFQDGRRSLEVNSGGQIFKFLLKRYAKFYLNYWVIFVIFVPIGIFWFHRPLAIPYGSDANIPISLIKDLLGLQRFNSYNITWWFNQTIIVLWLVFPILYVMVKNKYVALCLLPASMVFMPTNGLAFLLGIYLAVYRDKFEMLMHKVGNQRMLGVLTLFFVFLCLNRQKAWIECLSWLNADPYIALVLAVLIAEITKLIAYQFPVFAFLGKHSMNMYMVHTFIFGYFFSSFIYGFKYPILIFMALLFSSLGVSITLEYVKHRIGFYSLINHISSKLSA